LELDLPPDVGVAASGAARGCAGAGRFAAAGGVEGVGGGEGCKKESSEKGAVWLPLLVREGATDIAAFAGEVNRLFLKRSSRLL